MQHFTSPIVRPSKRLKIGHDSNEVHKDSKLTVEELDKVSDHEPDEDDEDNDIDDEAADSSDSFTSHFADPEDNRLIEVLESIKNHEWCTKRMVIQKLGLAFISQPASDSPEGKMVLQTAENFTSFGLKEKLFQAVQNRGLMLEGLEKYIAPVIFGYQDLLFCERTRQNSSSLRDLYCLHVVNHIFK